MCVICCLCVCLSECECERTSEAGEEGRVGALLSFKE